MGNEIAQFPTKSKGQNYQASKKRKLDENTNNHPAKRMKVSKNKIKLELDEVKQENKDFLEEIDALKKDLNEINNSELKRQRDELQKKVNAMELKSERINAMSLDELDQTKIGLQEKIKLIEDAERLLMDNTYKCIACKNN